jgi:hypothetical protein
VCLAKESYKKLQVEVKASRDWAKLPSVAANVVSWVTPGPAPTPWLEKIVKVEPKVESEPTSPIKKIKNEFQSPMQQSPKSPYKFAQKNKQKKRQCRVTDNRAKLTRGSDSRKREKPTAKRDTLDKLYQTQKECKNGTSGKPKGTPVFEYVSQMLKVPISNLRLWDKTSTKIYKLAGDIEASMIMGVKQRRLAVKVRAMLNITEPSLAPLVGFLEKELQTSLTSKHIRIDINTNTNPKAYIKLI